MQIPYAETHRKETVQRLEPQMAENATRGPLCRPRCKERSRQKPARGNQVQQKARSRNLLKRKPKIIRPRKGPIVAFPGSTFPNSCNRAPLRRFPPMPKRIHAFDGLHMPSRTRVFDRLSCAEKKSIDCPSVHFFLARLRARQTKGLKEEKPTSLEAGFQIQNGARGESRTRTSFDNGF